MTKKTDPIASVALRCGEKFEGDDFGLLTFVLLTRVIASADGLLLS